MIPEHPKVCAFCGARPQQTVLMVAHVNGREDDNEPDNLTWSCRQCNSVASNTLQNARLGRRTHQFNPTKSGGAASVGEWINAVGAITPHIDRGDRGLSSTMSVSDAVAMIRATPHHKRSEFWSKLRSGRAGRAADRWNPMARKQNMWPFSPSKKGPTSPRQTTPARGGIAERLPKRKGKAGSVTAGTYRGYTITGTREGEYYTSLDPDSLFETQRQARSFIDSWIKGRENPAYYLVADGRSIPASKQWTIEDAERKAAELNAKRRAAGKPEIYGVYVPDLRARLGYVPNPSKFDRCVKDVKAKGGDVNAYAVCTAAGTRNPSKFEKCVQDVESRGYARDPRAVCAAAGRAKYGQREMTRRAVAGKRKAARGNPADTAVSAYEEFHGHPPDETITVTKEVHFHEHLAGIGLLKRLKVKGVDHQIHVIQGFKGALLASSEAGDQLYIEGGDQSIDLREFGISKPHEREKLGKVLEVDYFTRKDHLGQEGGEAVYTHAFGTTNKNGEHVRADSARLPELVYVVRDQALEFVGGSYEIRAEGIDK